MHAKNSLKFVIRAAWLPAIIYSLCSTGVSAQDPQPLPVSKGVYRLPYADGTNVGFSNDHTNHPASLNRIDMSPPGAGPFTVVSAGAGWIRMIIETSDTKCPNACSANSSANPPIPENDCDGDGVVTLQDNQQAQQTACGGYSGPSTFCCERDFESNGGNCPGAGTCQGTPNNLVWIEHTNGEWTKYTHMQRGSIGQGTDNTGNPGAGRFVGEFVAAGTSLGLEGDVGFASGPHVHFEVGVPSYVELAPLNTSADPDRPPDTIADWFNGAGFLVGDGTTEDVDNDGSDDVNLQNRIPVFCQIGFAVGGGSATAGPCDDQCSTDTSQLVGTITAGNIFQRQVTQTMGNPVSDFVVAANSGVMIKAGQRITLSPGFHAEADSFFSASIGGCDTPGGTGE